MIETTGYMKELEESDEEDAEEAVHGYLHLCYLNVVVNDHLFSCYDIPLCLEASVLSPHEAVIAVLCVNELVCYALL